MTNDPIDKNAAAGILTGAENPVSHESKMPEQVNSMVTPDPAKPKLDKGSSGLNSLLKGLAGVIMLMALYYWLGRPYAWVGYSIIASLLVCLSQFALLLPYNVFKKWRATALARTKNPADAAWLQENPPPGAFLRFLGNTCGAFIFLSLAFSVLATIIVFKPVIGLMLGVLVLLICYGMLTKFVGVKISQEVNIASRIAREQALTKEMPVAEPVSDKKNLSVTFTINRQQAHDLPEVTGETAAQYEVINLRGPSINRAYKIGIGAFLVPTFLLTWIFYLLHPAKGDVLLSVAFTETTFAAFTLFYFYHKISSRPFSELLLNAFLQANEIEAKEDREEKEYDPDDASSLRCRRLFFISIFWIGMILITLRFVYLSYGPITNPLNLLCAGLCIFSIVAYLVWFHKQKTTIERLYPLAPAYDLLALRVFSSSNISNFMDLIQQWKYFGSTSQLDGPDTVGQKFTDVINYLKGHTKDSIVLDDEHLEKTLGSFNYTADKFLRYGINTMQCTGATWKKAIQRMFEKADVVVMDMSAISPHNVGIAYELGKVINEFPLQRVVMLVDHRTDEEVLKGLLTKICDNIAADSPNYGNHILTLNLLDTSGFAVKEDGETDDDFNKRVLKRINKKQLISLLLSAAKPRLNPAADMPLPAWQIRWADPFVSRNPKLWNIFALVALVFLVIWIFVSAAGINS